MLGEIVEGSMKLSGAGEIVLATWNSLADRFMDVATDAFVVMPNHIHGILFVGAQFIAPAERPSDTSVSFAQPCSEDAAGAGSRRRIPTLGECVRTLKAASTRLIRLAGESSFAWQRNYYEHVIRNEDELWRTRQYIETNPANWASDVENPDRA